MLNENLYDFVDPADAECVRREVEITMREYFPNYDEKQIGRASCRERGSAHV